MYRWAIQKKTNVFFDSNRSIEERLDWLIANLTLEEKSNAWVPQCQVCLVLALAQAV